MPVIGVVILPICAIAVGMSAACCGDLFGFKNLLANGAFLMLSAVSGFGSCRVNDPLAGAVSRYIGLIAALALMPVIGVVILPICAIAVGMCCGDRCGFKHLLADGTLLMLQAGLRLSRRFVYLPHEGVGRQILCAAARIRAGAVGALMPVAVLIRIPRAASVGMGVGTLIRAHGDLLIDLDTAIAAAIVILDRHIRLPLRELVTMEDRIVVLGEVSRGAVGIMRGDHHALRVELVAGHVLGLGGRCCDLDALHRLDDLQHLKLVEYPHIDARLSRWILLEFACRFPVYGHLILCKLGVGILRFCVNKDFYRILRICLNRGVRCQIIPAAACIALLNGNLMDINAHLIC